MEARQQLELGDPSKRVGTDLMTREQAAVAVATRSPRASSHRKTDPVAAAPALVIDLSQDGTPPPGPAVLIDQTEAPARSGLTRLLAASFVSFLGDGMLAIFRTDDRRRAETCAAALAAASEALDLMELLAARRREVGRPTPGLGRPETPIRGSPSSCRMI